MAEDELFVPAHRGVDFREVLGRTIDNGLKGSLWKAPTLGWAFSLMAGMSIGIAQGALERFLQRSSGRPIRGTTYKNQLEATLSREGADQVATLRSDGWFVDEAVGRSMEALAQTLAVSQRVADFIRNSGLPQQHVMPEQ